MRRALPILCAAIAFAAGCATTETRTGGTILPPGPNAVPPAFGSASQTSVSAIGVCTVSYDGFTLPLVSPDGRWLASQIGVAPTWPTLLASPGQTAPMASAIEIWSLDAKSGRRVKTLRKGLILGRSADVDGFLVEEVLDDGSRRIGRALWPADRSVALGAAPAEGADPVLPSREDEPEWIVQDGRVNAFACLSPDGRSIAWCSRDLRDTAFSLSVRHGGNASHATSPTAPTDWDLPPDPEQSWMLPVFAADGRAPGAAGPDDEGASPTLFALCLRDGIADLAAGSSADATAFRQSLVRRRLSVRMDAQRTYQVLAPQGTAAAIGSTGDERDGHPTLVLFDPDLRRMSTWDPATDTFRPLAAGTFAACFARDGSALASDRDGLILDHPEGTPGFPPRVYPRASIPRLIREDSAAGITHPWVLLVPERKTISVVRFALLGATLTGN